MCLSEDLLFSALTITNVVFLEFEESVGDWERDSVFECVCVPISISICSNYYNLIKTASMFAKQHIHPFEKLILFNVFVKLFIS